MEILLIFWLVSVAAFVGYALGYGRADAAVPVGKPDTPPDHPQFPGLSAEQVQFLEKVHADYRNDRAREILAEARRRTEDGTLTEAEHDEIVNVLLDNGYLKPENP